MGLSETILAAVIGGLATISAALFQLFMAFKASEKADPRAKRGSKLRSLLSIAALMVASAVGGFLYSEFLKQRSGEQLQAMRDELREVKELAALTAARLPAPAQVVPADVTTAQVAQTSETSRPKPAVVSTASANSASSAEALIYVPTCQSGAAEMTTCLENQAQRVALCSTIPAAAEVTNLELFAQPDAAQQPWEQHPATLEQDLGGARFTGNSFEYAQAAGHKAVCVNFMQWNSATAYLARVVVHYGAGAPQSSPIDSTAVASSGVDPTLGPQTASFISSQAVESK